MKTEVQQLERLKVGRCLVERDGRALAKEKQVTVLTSRWVLTQKTSEIVRCRLVVRDFATGGTSALNAGIYAPTSSLDGLRFCDLVLLPANLTIKGCRVIAWLGESHEWAQVRAVKKSCHAALVFSHGSSAKPYPTPNGSSLLDGSSSGTRIAVKKNEMKTANQST